MTCFDQDYLQEQETIASDDGCDVTLKYLSQLGCTKYQYGVLAMFMSQYSFLFGGIMIVFGLILAFFGNKFVTVVIAIMTALATLVLGVYFTAMFVDAVFDPESIKDFAVWIILGIWVIIAVVAGVFIAKKRKWGLAVVGAFGGVMIGLLLTTVFGPSIKSAGVYYAIIIACALVAFFVAFKTEKFVLIFCTSFIGSYLFVRGISMYAGGFPNETELHTIAKEGYMTWDTFPKIFYVYVAGILIMTIGTCVF